MSGKPIYHILYLLCLITLQLLVPRIVPKIVLKLFDIEEQFLTPYFHNRLWVPQVQELTVKKACKANAWPLHSCYSTWPSYDYAVSIASPLEISLKASKYCVKTASFIA